MIIPETKLKEMLDHYTQDGCKDVARGSHAETDIINLVETALYLWRLHHARLGGPLP